MLRKILLTSFLCSLCTLTISAQQVETPSGLIYTPENPQLEFNYLKTYPASPEEKGTIAAEEFPQSTTTYVYAEIEFKNLLYEKANKEYTISFKWRLANGKKVSEYITDFLIEKDWSSAYYYDSYGWDTPGKWPVGTHSVEVFINGKKIAVRKFKITRS